jgi:hypothetical protein
MPRSRFALGFGRVNLIKKVKVDGKWRFCPAIVDPGRRLSDKVRVNGETEIHNEGTYYLEWREHGRRRRQPVYSRALVIDRRRRTNPEGQREHDGDRKSWAEPKLPKGKGYVLRYRHRKRVLQHGCLARLTLCGRKLLGQRSRRAQHRR